MGLNQIQEAPPPVTAIYYSSNRERPEFENKIIAKIKQNCPYPIVSVTQKPVDLGTNICVGEHEQSYANALLQLKTGIEATDSPYITALESDCLYPPSYFTFIPPITTEAYFYKPIWILQSWIGEKFGNGFRKKTLCEGAMIGHRDHLLYRIKRARRFIKDRWVDQQESREWLQPMFWKHAYKPYWWTGDPVISVKTEQGVMKSIKDENINNVQKLPYWGEVNALRKELFEI